MNEKISEIAEDVKKIREFQETLTQTKANRLRVASYATGNEMVKINKSLQSIEQKLSELVSLFILAFDLKIEEKKTQTEEITNPVQTP